jgi:hypothetical protein
MHLRRSALAVLLATAVVVPAVSTAAVAWAKPASKPAAAQKAKPKPTKAPAKPTKTPAKPTKTPAKPVQVTFAANGTVTAVDAVAGTVVVAVKGGTKDVKGSSLTVVVPAAARIVLDDAPATLAQVQPGFRITVTGVRSGTGHTAAKIQASSPEVIVEPTPEPTPSPEV